MGKPWRTLAAALALLLAASPALAEERILDFDSAIAIQKDGALDVTETIRVRAERNQINHGIYRDFPTRYKIPRGGKMKVGFELLDTAFDGGAVDNAVESIGNGVRIKLGSASSYVDIGEHSYRIHYRVTRELGYFKDYDELYWNVTGNGWGFPIDRASALITLPKPVKFGQRAAYSGRAGSTSSEVAITVDEPGQIGFATTQPLAPYEGLTVAAAFPKGTIDEPSANQRLGWMILDWLPIIAAAVSLAGITAFLFYGWKRAGRDPPEGSIVPLFAPPDGMSPGAMRYLVKQKLDNRAFAATIVEAGVTGHIKLVEDKGLLGFGGKKYIEGSTFAPIGMLGSAEATAIRTLVEPGERIELDNENHATFSAAKNGLESAYKQRFEDSAFKRNSGWAALAVGVWAVGAYLTALAIVIADGSAPALIQFGPLVALALAAWLYFLSKAKRPALIGCGLKMAALMAVSLAGLGGFAIFGFAVTSGRWMPLVLILLGLPLALSSLWWISAPTAHGRLLLDQIAGFKHYLSVTEKERLDRMQAPADTLRTFERFLPYAIALGVENRWADRFESQLAAAAAAGQQGFAWYAGSHSPWTDASGFTNSIGSSLSSSISSASTAPGSSSGSGGGGSSGGGGGGGGGGGW